MPPARFPLSHAAAAPRAPTSVFRLALDWVVHRASPAWARCLLPWWGRNQGWWGRRGEMPAGEEAGICLAAGMVPVF